MNLNLLARFFIALCLLACILFGCKTAPRYQKGGVSSQSFPQTSTAPALSPAPEGNQTQTLAQPENAQGQSKQTMTEERTIVHLDGTVERTKRTAGTVLGGSQSLTDILKTYYDDEYSKRLILALLMGGAAWYFRTEWPVKAGILAIGAILTAFFGPIASALTAAVCGGIFVAYHVSGCTSML